MPGAGEAGAPAVPTGSPAAPFWAFMSTLSQFLQPSSPPPSSTLFALPVCPPLPAFSPKPVHSQHAEDEDDEQEPEDVPTFVGCPEGLEGSFAAPDVLSTGTDLHHRSHLQGRLGGR